MEAKIITGRIVSQPVVLAEGLPSLGLTALVLVAVKTDDGYKELHYVEYGTALHRYANTMFSKIATSAIGETVEATIELATGRIIYFKNIRKGVILWNYY